MRTQQEDKLNEVLRNFEQVARDSASNALELSIKGSAIDFVSAFGYLLVLYLPKLLGRMDKITL